MKSKPKVIAVVGQTASGKSSLAINIAKKFNGEVISADSRQVYRGMDIGTGKVTLDEMSGIKHHLLDITNPSEVYTAADFSRDADIAIIDIISRGKVPVITGGTFFYIQLLRGELQSAPVAPDEEFRNSLENYSNEELFKKLSTLDANRAAAIDKNNRRRLIRALEIINKLGSVPATKKVDSPYEWLLIGTKLTKEELHKSIDSRLNQRLESGMIEEAKQLHDEGVTFEKMDSFGLEYRYLAQYLQNQLSETGLRDELNTKIRQYAKRQLTWLKRDENINWFNPLDLTEIYDSVDKFLQQDIS
jgi:tRNA dimethylallyltransferase